MIPPRPPIPVRRTAREASFLGPPGRPGGFSFVATRGGGSLGRGAGLALWLVLLAGGAKAGAGEGGRAAPATAFADQLYLEGDDYRAIGEYRRFLFEHPGDPATSSAWLQIGRSYLRGKKWQPALTALQHAGESARDTPSWSLARAAMGDVELIRGSYDSAAYRYRALLVDDPSSAPTVVPRLALAYFAEERPDLALRLSDETTGPLRTPIREAAARWNDLPGRSPVLAGVFSALVPGAGQLYAGRPSEAFSALLVNALLGLAAYEAFSRQLYAVGGAVAFFGLGFYGGNIYGAVNDAERRNQTLEEGVLDRLRSETAPDLPPFGAP